MNPVRVPSFIIPDAMNPETRNPRGSRRVMISLRHVVFPPWSGPVSKKEGALCKGLSSRYPALIMDDTLLQGLLSDRETVGDCFSTWRTTLDNPLHMHNERVSQVPRHASERAGNRAPHHRFVW